MTMWDANLAELRQALNHHGFRPLDDAHVFTCAIDALNEQDERLQEAVLPSDLKEAEEAQRDAEREAAEANKRIEDLEEDLDRTTDEAAELRSNVQRLKGEIEDLRQAVTGDGAALVERTRAAEAQVAETREKSSAFLQQIQARLRGILAAAERSRTDKDYIRFNARDMLQQIEREIA